MCLFCTSLPMLPQIMSGVVFFIAQCFVRQCGRNSTVASRIKLQVMAIVVCTQDGDGGLYEELLRADPILVSSDEECDVAAPITHGRGESVEPPSEATARVPDSAALTRDGGEGVALAGPVEHAEHDPIKQVDLGGDDPIEHSPRVEADTHGGGATAAGRKRTSRPLKWGRCMACGAPLRVRFTDAQLSVPFLGCSTFKSKNPRSCRFTALFPQSRAHELPQRIVLRRRVSV